MTELPTDRIRVNCIWSGGILTLLILSTCQSGEKATEHFLEKGAFRSLTFVRLWRSSRLY